MAADQLAASLKVEQFKVPNAPVAEISSAGKVLATMPNDEVTARMAWTAAKAAADIKSQPLNGMPPHATQFAGDPNVTPDEQLTYDTSRRNFLALVF